MNGVKMAEVFRSFYSKKWGDICILRDPRKRYFHNKKKIRKQKTVFSVDYTEDTVFFKKE
jgi:hypothetical protein